MSRLLPQFKEEGLVQDRLWVFETEDDDIAKAIIAVMKNRNHRSTEVLFSSMRMSTSTACLKDRIRNNSYT